MRIEYPISIYDGIRNLCLGRVLLKSDAFVGDTEIPVGVEFASPDEGASVPGVYLFYSNPLDESGEAVVVQPTAADLPDNIEYQETVTIDQSELGTTELHLKISDGGGLANDYTTARGAYVRLSNLPSLCSDLRVIERDFFPLAGWAPPDYWFPGILIVVVRTERESLTNVQYIDNYNVVVRYARTFGDDYDRSTLQGEVETLLDLLSEDLTLGGTCWDSNITQPLEMPAVPGILRRGPIEQSVMTEKNRNIDWADIHLVAKKLYVVDKAPTPLS